MTVRAVIQARMGSSRFPGKVLKPLLGVPMLARQIERLRRAQCVGTLVVATTTCPEDDAIADLCAEIGVDCRRGSVEDVLDRIYRSVAAEAPETVLRVTADCPLIDWTIVDRVVDFHLCGAYDYTSNQHPPTWPDGLDVEAISFAALESAWREAALSSEREHVTPFLWRRPGRFRIANVSGDGDLSHHRWTVDHPVDFALIEAVYEALYPRDPMFLTSAVLEFLAENPQLVALNAHIVRNEGYAASLEADRDLASAHGSARNKKR